jgi:hypothetical protein
MRNSSVPAETIWPLVTLRRLISPETGARIAAWARRAMVSLREASAAASWAAAVCWRAVAVSSEAWDR